MRQNRKRLLWIGVPLLIILFIPLVVSIIWSLWVLTFVLNLLLLGPFLALLVVASFALGIQPSSKPGWGLSLGCGLIGGAAAALACWLFLGPGVISLPMTLVLVLAAGLAAPTGGALRHTIGTLWPRLRRGRAPDTPEPAPTAASANLSRREVLLGLGGLAGLAAMGTGFTWLARSLLTHLSPLVLYKSFDSIQSLCWSPDGKRIISVVGGDRLQGGQVTIWDAASGKEIVSAEDTKAKGYGAIQAVAWSPNGTRLTLGSSTPMLDHPEVNAAIVDAATLRPLVTFSAGKPGTSSGVFAILWSSDSKRIATGSDTTDSHQVQVWDAVTGKQLLILAADAALLSWSPDGRYLVTVRYLVTENESDLQVWDAASGALLTTHRGDADGFSAAAWSPDSTSIAAGSLDGTVQVWEARSGRRLLTYRGDSFGVVAVAWSPDGSRIASAGVDGDVQVRDATTGEEVFLYKGHTQQVNTLAWSPDGTRIASGSEDKTVQIWLPA
jgi:Tol biopolymer transport system component